MELTREEVSSLTTCGNCTELSCFRYEKCQLQSVDAEIVNRLAKQLLAEMDKQKDDVWKNAPKDATGTMVYYFIGDIKQNITACYTRTIHKSPEREIAERLYKELCKTNMADETSISAIESAIKEYKESVK